MEAGASVSDDTSLSDLVEMWVDSRQEEIAFWIFVLMLSTSMLGDT